MTAYSDTLFQDVRDAYDDYQDRKKRVAAIVKAEVEERIRREEGDLLRDLSKIVHDAHSKGLSKVRLREATRKYGSALEFAKIWDAYRPVDEETPLRSGAKPPYEFNGSEWLLVRSAKGYLDRAVVLDYEPSNETIWPNEAATGMEYRDVRDMLRDHFEGENPLTGMNKFLREALTKNDDWADFTAHFTKEA